MWKRVASRYPLWYDPEPLACYRQQGRSASRALIRSGENIAEVRRSIESSQSYLPSAMAADMVRRARKYYTRHVVHLAGQLLFVEHDVGQECRKNI